MHDAQKAAQGSVHESSDSLIGRDFPPDRRLKRHAEFQTVFSRNKRISNRKFRILVHNEQNRSGTRLGIVVSRRVSKKSVERNRIKRQVRECFRANQHKLINRDMVVIAHRDCATATNSELRKSLTNLFQQLEN